MGGTGGNEEGATAFLGNGEARIGSRLEDSYYNMLFCPPWFCQINEEPGCALRALETKAQPLLLQLRSHVQITTRQCDSLLPLGLRSKHFSTTVAILHSNQAKTTGSLPFIFFAHIAYLVNPCLSFRTQLRGHLFQECFFDPYSSTLPKWMRSPSKCW